MSSHLFTQHACKELDAVDPLAPFRSQFELPEHIIYLDGNSLGALPKATAPRISQVPQHALSPFNAKVPSKLHKVPLQKHKSVPQVVQQEWGRDLISSWNKHGWWQVQQRVGRKISRIIGAAADEVLVADSTSINLFKVVAAALDLHPGKIIVSGAEF